MWIIVCNVHSFYVCVFRCCVTDQGRASRCAPLASSWVSWAWKEFWSSMWRASAGWRRYRCLERFSITWLTISLCSGFHWRRNTQKLSTWGDWCEENASRVENDIVFLYDDAVKRFIPVQLLKCWINSLVRSQGCLFFQSHWEFKSGGWADVLIRPVLPSTRGLKSQHNLSKKNAHITLFICLCLKNRSENKKTVKSAWGELRIIVLSFLGELFPNEHV